MISARLEDADAGLAQLVASAEAGEDVVLEREGRPIARLVLIDIQRQSGSELSPSGRRWPVADPTAEEWAAMDRDVQALFEESISRPLDEPARFDP